MASRLRDDVGLYADDLREWTRPCAALALAIKDLPVQELVLEGTLCVLDEQGRPDFEALRQRITTGTGGPLVFMVSDCLHLDSPLDALPLRERRDRLGALITPAQRSLSVSPALEGELDQVLRSLREMGLPDVVARRLESAGRDSLVPAAGEKPVALGRSLSAAPKVTNAAKVLFPRDGLTKDDLAAYYRDIAPALLPHMRARPIVGHAGKSLVLPYSLRAVDGAPVSAPIQWNEVTTALDPKAFTLRTIRARLDAKGDLFEGALRGAFRLEAVLQRLRAQS